MSEIENISKELSDFIFNVYELDLLVNLTDKTKLYENLKLTGEDAYEFLNLFCSHFKLKVYDFNFQERFESEGLNLIKGNSNKIDMTLGELDNCIKIGYLGNLPK